LQHSARRFTLKPCEPAESAAEAAFYRAAGEVRFRPSANGPARSASTAGKPRRRPIRKKRRCRSPVPLTPQKGMLEANIRPNSANLHAPASPDANESPAGDRLSMPAAPSSRQAEPTARRNHAVGAPLPARAQHRRGFARPRTEPATADKGGPSLRRCRRKSQTERPSGAWTTAAQRHHNCSARLGGRL